MCFVLVPGLFSSVSDEPVTGQFQGWPPSLGCLPLGLGSAGQRPRASPGSSRLVFRPGAEVVTLSLCILYESLFFIPQMRFLNE